MIKCLKGNVIFAEEKNKLKVMPHSYLVINNERSAGVYESLPEEYKNAPVEDLGDKLIIPGFMDVHLHAPQWLNKGVGYSEELLPWLQKYTFPLESKFADIKFAEKYYKLFVDELKSSGTTRACIFASRHYEATKLLIELMKESGIGGYVGKVNMDRNSSEELQETYEDSVKETTMLAKEYSGDDNALVKFILTPRFVPSTTSELMTKLGEIAEKYNLHVQSHLDENVDEVAWVKELHSDIPTFTEVYEHFGLLPDNRTVMAHCIHNNDREIEVLKKHNTFIAHCPLSNFNLASGIAPIKRYMEEGLDVGLGSDISGGHTLYMPVSCVAAVSASKIYHVSHKEYSPLTFAEAFYLLTKGGGKFFGKVGSFEEGYECDALVIDDSNITSIDGMTLEERLEKFIYTGNRGNIVRIYCRGKQIK